MKAQLKKLLETYASNVKSEIEPADIRYIGTGRFSHDISHDKNETVNALLTIALSCIELMGEESDNAVTRLSEAFKSEADNRISKMAEDQAESADFVDGDFESADSDQAGVLAWFAFSELNFEPTVCYDDIYAENLPSTLQCECGELYTEEQSACPTCERIDFERTHTYL